MEYKGNKITKKTWNWLNVNESIIPINNKDKEILKENFKQKERKKQSNKKNTKEESDNICLIDNCFENIEYGISKEVVTLNRRKRSKKMFLNGKETHENILDSIELNKEKQKKHLELYPKSRSNALRIKIKEYSDMQLDIYLKNKIEATYILEFKQVFNLVIRIVLENAKLNLIIIDREIKEKIKGDNKENGKIKLESISVIGKENSKIDIVKIDIGEYDKYFNYISDLVENQAEVNMTLAYVLNKKQVFDMSFNQRHMALNTIGNIKIEGVQKDESSKIFKGTIDFKKGSKGSIGNEYESITNYSKKTKSISLPILLTAENEIFGNHSASHGKYDNEQLYYIQSRGFNIKEAQNIIAESKIIPILDQVKSRRLKEELKNSLKDKLKN